MSKLKYGMAKVSAIGAFVGVAALSLPQALAQQPMGTSEDAMDQQSYNTQRATTEYEIQKQECDTLRYNQPQSYEPCLEKAKSTRQNLLSQGAGQAGQGSQGFGSQQSGQQQGPIEKVTSVVKEKLADWGIGSGDQGRGGQPSTGQQGQGSGQGQQGQGQGSGQGYNPLQQSFGAGQGMQGQGSAQQPFGGGAGQGGQTFGQQGTTQGQQFSGQPGQPGQGSFQGGTYGQQPQGQASGQQPQGQASQQGTGGPSQQSQSGGTQGLQGSFSQQGASTGSAGGEEEHMNSAEYHQELARRQFEILKQECNSLKRDPSVFEQCQQHAKSVRDKIAGMAEQG